MICPKCKAEYRQGFTMCADCEVMLVTHLPQRAMSGAMMGARQDSEADLDSGGDAHAGEANGREVSEESEAAEPGDPNRDPFCSFWKGTDLRVCTEICTVLDEAGIPHKTIRRQDHLFNFNNQSPYEIGVPASVYEKAELAIKEAFGTEEETSENPVHLLPPPEEDPRSQKLRSVWVGNDMQECAAHCSALKQAAIYYQVDEQRRAMARSVESRYEIGVSQADFEKAHAITHDNVMDFSDEPEDQKIMEIPDTEESFAAERVSSPSSKGREWFPEDATSLAWNGERADSRWIIEMSLKENDIPMRWEAEDGKPQLFVLPEDEKRAKEIVREIVDGAPLGSEEGGS